MFQLAAKKLLALIREMLIGQEKRGGGEEGGRCRLRLEAVPWV